MSCCQMNGRIVTQMTLTGKNAEDAKKQGEEGVALLLNAASELLEEASRLHRCNRTLETPATKADAIKAIENVLFGDEFSDGLI